MISFWGPRMAFAGLMAVALAVCFSGPASAASGIPDAHVEHSPAADPNAANGFFFKRSTLPRPGHIDVLPRPSGAEDEESLKFAAATNGLVFSRPAQRHDPSRQRLSRKPAFLIPYETGPPVA
ncbi:MAG: hypothetical protein R3229_05965 [Alphaproteobacteria bacterium]|nr:hypothetical protein [Alphaproteobacteria bacterium]